MPQSNLLLLDILGVLIGFVVVMLLLSLIVTAVVQFIQSFLGMRPRNLLHGVSGLLESVLAQGPEPAAEVAAPAAAVGAAGAKPVAPAVIAFDAKALASKALNVARFAPGRKPEEPKQDALNPLNPLMSWVEPDELVIRLDELGTKLTSTQKNKLQALYGRMEKYLSKRFSLHVRYVTIAVAVIVAVVFQVSAPHLIQELSTNPQARARAVALSERLLEKYKGLDLEPAFSTSVQEQALEMLAAKYPDHAKKLEEASGGPSRTESLREVALVLGDASKKDEILKEYDRILDELYAASAESARERLKESAGDLALLNVVPFGRGAGFYKDPVRLIGVVVTAILLTLGAPFWYEMLRDLSNLRDALKAKPKEKEKSK